MQNKIILITITSGGIGKETARSLAKQGHDVIIYDRNAEKTRTAFEEIQKETNNKNLDMMIADLSLMSEVKDFAEKVKVKYSRIDALINNAWGQFDHKREATKDGMAINLLAPFLLTHLLLEALSQSSVV